MKNLINQKHVNQWEYTCSIQHRKLELHSNADTIQFHSTHILLDGVLLKDEYIVRFGVKYLKFNSTLGPPLVELASNVVPC